MKTLIVEVMDTKRIGELVTVGRIFGDTPDILALGTGDVPGTYTKAYFTDTAVGANLIDPLVDLIREGDYQLVLLSATTLGTEIAGPLGVRLGAPVLSEVIGASADMTVTRPIYGGKAVATFKIDQAPAILTVRRKYFEPADLAGTTTPVPLAGTGTTITLISEEAAKSEGIPLEDAEVIVSGGRGMGSGENFTLLREMAGILNAAVGASRGAVDEGWAAPTLQIGQTGNIVAPSVYLAVGISGASQHLAGIANAKCVVAVNKDEDANIFKRARFGIVEDYKKVVPALIQALKEEQ
ncbi:electron transfer flavoprotein subunit beta [Desulfosarcina ovata subsp. sediminis]|uniref:Electron transfer flavoprotein subunit beta n=1 Tax=Desulfosarcina ovata subsp. sediminis TaxID=885957 RepID=A0A5K7ZEZ2_9BACT|nr:electron transfer flavoprotein subunit alpha/FixB family protein [Desulfosarcina ovata]BBO79481.1 electron transfer flavoprotein subunit beta [Desulfosarcina ovata subsp. sediminis]BBO86001.1 electron transfer flavoprotein subunit beta [Desulfosarcina ovata subsp. sediminis]